MDQAAENMKLESLLKKEIEDYVDEIKIDKLGNLIAIKKRALRKNHII